MKLKKIAAICSTIALFVLILDGLCRADREHWYKTNFSFKKPISFKQDIVNQCKKIDNCTCDKSNNCTLHVYEEILSIPEPQAYNVIGRDIYHYFNFDDANVLPIGVEQLSNKNEYRVSITVKAVVN